MSWQRPQGTKGQFINVWDTRYRSIDQEALTLSGLGEGGNISPLTFERLSSKNYFGQWSITFWQFLNMFILWLQTKNCLLYPDRPAESFKFASQEILCIFWTYLHFSEYYSYLIMFGVQIYLILVTDFIVVVKRKFEAFWLLSYFGTTFWICFTGHFISRASARRSACALF